MWRGATKKNWDKKGASWSRIWWGLFLSLLQPPMFQCCILYISRGFHVVLVTKMPRKTKPIYQQQPQQQHKKLYRITNRMNTLNGSPYFSPARLHAEVPIVFMLSTKHASLKSKRLIIFGCFSMAFVSFISGRTCRKHHSFVTVAAAVGVVVAVIVDAVVVLVVTATNVCFRHVCRLPFF